MDEQEGKKPTISLIQAFPTLVCVYDWPDKEEFNRDLILELYQLRSRDPNGIYRSNLAGTWHSDLTVLKDCGEPGDQLGRMFHKVFSTLGDVQAEKRGGNFKLSLTAWAMIYSDRGYSTPHTHPNCHFSGVYYPMDGCKDEKVMATGVRVRPGTLEFMDVRGGPNAQQVKGLNLNPSVRLEPRAGRMVVFPAWLPHMVHPIHGREDRIAVACNASVVNYDPPKEEKSEQPAEKPKQREGKKAK